MRLQTDGNVAMLKLTYC